MATRCSPTQLEILRERTFGADRAIGPRQTPHVALEDLGVEDPLNPGYGLAGLIVARGARRQLGLPSALLVESSGASRAAVPPSLEGIVQGRFGIIGHVLHQEGPALAVHRELQLGYLRVDHPVRIAGLETWHGIDLHRAAAHLARTGVKPAAIDEGIVEELADLAPGLRNVIGDRPLEVGRAQETGPTLVAGGRVARGAVRKRQSHPGIAQELAVGISRKRQGIGRDQQPVAQLGDAQAIVGQGLVAVEERPARRPDLVVVALRRGVHAELGRAVAEVVARPVAQAALHRLKHAAPGGTPLRPLAGQRALRAQAACPCCPSCRA